MVHDHDPLERTPELPFADRRAAGMALADLVVQHDELRDADAVVIALPRGGVPVGAEVARALGVPLDVIVVRKLGVPGRPELAMGAIGEGGVRVLEREVLTSWPVTDEQLSVVEAREQRVLEARAARLRAGRERVPLAGRVVVLVDDGLATGSTARAAIDVARASGAAKVVLAVPVAPRSTVTDLSAVADAVVCVATPWPFAAIGQWYRDFSATSDDEVVRILDTFAG